MQKLGFVITVVITILLLCHPGVQAEFQFPLKSISPDTTPYGVQQIRIDIDYNQGERLLFQREDKDREVYQMPSLDIGIGISPTVELLFSYPFLYLKQKDQRSNYGSGDLKITSVFRVMNQAKPFMESALKLAVKLPNADDLREFGTDETDFFVGGIFQKRIGKIKLLANADLAIIGNPISNETEQDDVLVYSLGTIFPLRNHISAGIEIHGVEFSRYGNDRCFIRGGIVYGSRSVLIDIGGAVGLTEESGAFQVGIGITFKYGLAKKEMASYRYFSHHNRIRN
jgi:hypothetical protein